MWDLQSGIKLVLKSPTVGGDHRTTSDLNFIGDRPRDRTQKRGWGAWRSRRRGAGTSSRAGSDSEAGERAAAAGSSRRGRKLQASLRGALARRRQGKE